MLQLFSSAYAEASPVAHQGGSPMVAQLLMVAGFVVIFWLLIWRPQSKKAKAHKQLINELEKGDEVVTSGGLLGRVTKVSDDYITLKVNTDMQLNFQRTSIASTLPKGTIKGLD